MTLSLEQAKLLDLADRCEKAAGHDRELDKAIFDALPFDALPKGIEGIARYTASLDAAMTLVPEGHDWQINLYAGRDGKTNSAIATRLKQINLPRVFAATPALALCAAALRAKAATLENNHD